MGAINDFRKTSIPTAKSEGERYFVKTAGSDAYVQYVVDISGNLVPPAVMAHGHAMSDIVGLSAALAAKSNIVTLTAGAGLTGGGDTSANRSFAVNFGTAAGTVAQGNDSRILNGQTAHERWIATPYVTDINNITNGGVHTYVSPGTNAPSAYGTVLTFVGASPTGNAASGSYVNQLIYSDNNDLYIRRGGGSPVAWGTMYRVWTTRHFDAATAGNWNTAYGWGNHALAGYALNSALAGKENAFSKGSIVAGSGVTITGTLTNRLVGSGDITINSTAVGGVTSVGLSAPGAFTVSGSPVTGSGTLSLGMATGYFVPTLAQKDAWDAAHFRWIGSPYVGDINDAVNGGVYTYTNPGSNAPSTYGTVFTFVGASTTGNAASGAFVNQFIYTDSGDLHIRRGGGSAPVTWSTRYQVYTTKQISPSNIAQWNSATSNTGTVTQVGLVTPTGFNVTSSPVTGSGNISFEVASGYFIPTTGSKAGWDQSYNATITINGVSRVLRDSPSFSISSGSGTVTQVGLVAPTGFNILSAPVTGSGNLQFGFASGYSLPPDWRQSQWDAKLSGSGGANKFSRFSGSTLIDTALTQVDNYYSGEDMIVAGSVSRECNMAINGRLNLKTYTLLQLFSKSGIAGDLAIVSGGAAGLYWFDGSNWGKV